jgi:PelA/Pel-15E family pectate lyase
MNRFYLLVGLLALGAAQSFAEEPVTTWRGILNHPAEWYASSDATRIARNVLAYQHLNGGWGKNVNMARLMSDDERAEIARGSRTVDTTIDNGATHRQLRYLARVTIGTDDQQFRDAFFRGFDFLLEAQYENGGWPQFYPLRSGYYEHITFNDDAMIGVMSLLRDVAGKSGFEFVDGREKRKQQPQLRRDWRSS